jgi:Zn-dependent metalloprotease
MDNVLNLQGDGKDRSAVSTKDDAARQASQNLLADSNQGDTLTLAKGQSGPMKNVKPDGFSVIPPFLLNELARRTGDSAYARAARDAENMQSHGSVFRPNASTGENFHGAREVYDAKTKEELPGEKARFEGEKPTGDKEVDAAYDYTGFVRDFYQKEYNRNSIDGQGMKFVSTVNYGDNYENAFWDGSQMTYGRPGKDSPFKTFVLLDVAAHEITHGVTEKEANETYYGQSGALNESMSDVFGALITQYSKHQTADKGAWLVGEGIWKDNVKGRALRDMLNPGTAYDDPQLGKDPQPADMDHYYKTWGDNGGVHYNSGIPNRAFALFAKAVGGYAWEDPGHVWFAARKAAGTDPSFASFAYHTIEQAKALGHNDLVPKLEKAWATVGVKPDKDGKDTATPSSSSGGEDDGLRKPVRKAG